MGRRVNRWTSFVLTVALAVAASGCSILPNQNGPTNAGAQMITVYDTVPVTDKNGGLVRNKSGDVVFKLSNAHKMTERTFALELQSKAIQRCGTILEKQQDTLKAAIQGATTGKASAAWARMLGRRDLIRALKPDFDPTGCTALVKAGTEYWRTIQAELDLARQRGVNHTRLLVTALKTAGFYLITNSIGDTLVGIAHESGGVNIGNRVAGNFRGAGGGASGARGGGVGTSLDGNQAGDTQFNGDIVLTTGHKSPIQTGSGTMLGDHAQQQTGDGVLGYAVSRPFNPQQPTGDINQTSTGASGSIPLTQQPR